MKLVPVKQAVGMVLCHDITEIVPGRFKGAAFKRGQVIKRGDIGKLRDLGKEHIAVVDIGPDQVHEDDAAKRLAVAAAGKTIEFSEPSEGKVDLIAAMDGLLKIDVDRLNRINSIADIMMATLHTNSLVRVGQRVAGTRIIPLMIDELSLVEAESICSPLHPVVSISTIHRKTVGIVTTGSEVYNKRIDDKFGPIIMDKISALGSLVLGQISVPDDVSMTVEAITRLIQQGADMVILTGGMSVDPDDLTPASIRATGAEVVTYGAPVLPGAMFMLAYLGPIPIIGVPGCVMYHKASIFDLVLPRLLADERLTREDIIAYGHGGMCRGCEMCDFPRCGFGR